MKNELKSSAVRERELECVIADLKAECTQARSAALQEAAALAAQWGNARVPDGGGNALRNLGEELRALALDSVGGPIVDLMQPRGTAVMAGDFAELRKLAEGVPEHIRLKGWFVEAPAFGQQYVYADDFRGMGRQHIASLPAGKGYFGTLAAFIAAASPNVILQLIDAAARPPVSPATGTLSAAGRDVLAERQRQVDIKDWTPEHDDHHPSGEIAAFAAVYAMPPAARDWPAPDTGYGSTFGVALCPEDWQPKFGDRRRELVKAGALILAEIERLDRTALAPKEGAQ